MERRGDNTKSSRDGKMRLCLQDRALGGLKMPFMLTFA